ncbi:cathepsin propeptide inhibitor domain (I29) domain-containing protein [Phthorimaea operculella]|nr:cathepsin propeptide inhibitor domain (I29) domain-containing protein [Phthorimaea operculella]
MKYLFVFCTFTIKLSVEQHWLPPGANPDMVQYPIQEGPRLYQEFVKRYNKKFQNEQEYQFRYNNFLKTLHIINEMNRDSLGPQVGPNFFADFTSAEQQIIRESASTAGTEKPQQDPDINKMLAPNRLG